MSTQIDKISIHTQAQQRAAAVLDSVASFIKAGITEQDIVAECTQLLNKHQLPDTWYYNVPVLAYVGKRTILSMSGREYRPEDIEVKTDDVITIALSPKVEDHWAAIARTFCVHQGKVVTAMPAESPYYDICQFQNELHRKLTVIARPEMRFEDLYQYFNEFIQSAGYINLDYHGNLGHSLENDLSKRRFIEKGNRTQLSECDIFAFETHVGKSGNSYGTKHENIYYFNDGRLVTVPAEC